MIQFHVRIANLNFKIFCRYPTIQFICEDFISQSSASDCIIMASQEDIEKEWKRSPNFDGSNNSLRRKSYEPILEARAIYRKICELLSDNNIIAMHGAVVSYKSESYMFTAPSGTGKTTRALYFLKQFPGSVILNGDKPFIRFEKERAIICGTPWMGKENYGINAESPLKAIFFLERAKETRLFNMTFSEALPNLLKQVYIPEQPDNKHIIHLLQCLNEKVAFYRFLSSNSCDSVMEAWSYANKL